MRHYKRGRKLGTDASHTKAMKKNLVSALFLNDRIKTVEQRAKEIRGDVDRIIGWAKRGDIHSRRLAIAALGNKELVREIFEKVEQGMFQDRNGGYTRIMKLGNRKGDNASMVIMELITEQVISKKKDDDAKPATGGKATAGKATPKKASEVEGEKAAAEGVTDAAEAAEEAAAETAEDVAAEADAEVAEAAADAADKTADAAVEAVAEAVEEATEEKK